jgi:hypothetical protein
MRSDILTGLETEWSPCTVSTELHTDVNSNDLVGLSTDVLHQVLVHPGPEQHKQHNLSSKTWSIVLTGRRLLVLQPSARIIIKRVQ